MNQKTSVIVIVVLLAVAAVVGVVMLRQQRPTDVPEQTASPAVSSHPSPTAAATHVPALFTVTITEAGVDPKSLTIVAGDAVRFINRSSSDVWPASDPHPTHTDCPGFDAMRGLRTGEAYTLTFPVSETCGYHDHLDPSSPALRGTINVR